MKKSCSKLVLVFLMLAMMLCLSVSVQADTINKTGPQGMTFSTIPLPPIAPLVVIDWDWYLVATLLFLFL